MTRWIALLRGLNVGGKNRIRMEDLRNLFEQAGYTQVETYIQSGNVLFSSAADEPDIKRTIEDILSRDGGIQTTVILRSAEELHAMLAGCPFSSEQITTVESANTESGSFYVYLLPQVPDPALLTKLQTLPQRTDLFAVSDRAVYVLLCQSIRTSKLAIKLQKLLPEATVRNWNTLTRLHELSI